MGRKACPLVVLDSIEWVDTQSQLRIDRRQDKVDEWAELLKELDAHAIDTAKRLTGAPIFDHPFPPIELFTDGGINSPHFIGDGYHRFHTYRKAGRDAIPANVTVCEDPRFEAFKFALSANATHGIPRTNADKRNAVRQALACERLQGMSLRELAKVCGVSYQTVSNIKNEDAKGQVSNFDTPHEADTPAPDRPSTKVSTPREHEPPRTVDPVRLADTPTEEQDDTGPTNPLDKLKREVPTGLLAKYAAGKRMAEWRSTFNRLLKEITEESINADGMLPGFEHLQANGVQLLALNCKTCCDELKNAEYHTDCPDCNAGKANGKKCKTCSGSGFLTGSMYDRLPPKSKELLAS